MLTSNVVIWSPLLNLLVPFKLPSPSSPLDWSGLQLIRAPTSHSRAILPTFSRLCLLFLFLVGGVFSLDSSNLSPSGGGASIGVAGGQQSSGAATTSTAGTPTGSSDLGVATIVIDDWISFRLDDHVSSLAVHSYGTTWSGGWIQNVKILKP